MPSNKFMYHDKEVQHIEGRRWFQKTYGNTYHSVYFHFTDGSVERVADCAYGYGEGYLQTAYSKAGLDYGGTLELREKYGVTYSVSDVLKRDM